MSSIIYNILRRYNIFVHFDIQRKCCKLLTRSVFVVRFVNDIVELELSFCNNVFHWKGPIGPDKSEKIYNILRQYHICIKFDNQRKML